MRLSIQEASQRLGVTEHTIRRRLHEGELRGEQVPQSQGDTWVVVVDDNDLANQPTRYDSQEPVQAPSQPSAPAYVQPPPPPTFSTAQLAELHALRARVAVLEERDQSKSELIELLQDRLKSQDWQFGEVLNQLSEAQSRMLPPASADLVESEEDQSGAGWMFWKKGRAKAQV